MDIGICDYREFNKTFHFQVVGSDIIIFTNVSLKAEITCKDQMQQTVLVNVHSVPHSCSINIPGVMSYHPSKIVMYHMNFTHFVRNFSTEFAESETKELHLKFRKPVDHVPYFWTVYHGSVAPYMGLFNFLFIGLVIFLGVMLVRCIVIHKLHGLRLALLQPQGNASSE